MATDYDAPRKTDDELAEDSLEELKAQRANKAASAVDVDEVELAENLELPGADLSDESLTVRVHPAPGRRVHLLPSASWSTTAASWPRRSRASSSAATAPERTARRPPVRLTCTTAPLDRTTRRPEQGMTDLLRDRRAAPPASAAATSTRRRPRSRRQAREMAGLVERQRRRVGRADKGRALVRMSTSSAPGRGPAGPRPSASGRLHRRPARRGGSAHPGPRPRDPHRAPPRAHRRGARRRPGEERHARHHLDRRCRRSRGGRRVGGDAAAHHGARRDRRRDPRGRRRRGEARRPSCTRSTAYPWPAPAPSGRCRSPGRGPRAAASIPCGRGRSRTCSGIAGRATLGKRLIARFARNLGTLIPFFVGAAIGARSTTRETKKLAAAHACRPAPGRSGAARSRGGDSVIEPPAQREAEIDRRRRRHPVDDHVHDRDGDGGGRGPDDDARAARRRGRWPAAAGCPWPSCTPPRGPSAPPRSHRWPSAVRRSSRPWGRRRCRPRPSSADASISLLMRWVLLRADGGSGPACHVRRHDGGESRSAAADPGGGEDRREPSPCRVETSQ